MQIPENALTDLAGVPIFVNIDSTLVTSPLATLSSLPAALFKPKELRGHLRRKPVIPVWVLAGGLMVWAGSDWIARQRPTHESATGPATAMYLIRNEAAATADALPAVIPAPASSRPATATNFRGGPTRCGFDGGRAPTWLKRLRQCLEHGMLHLSSPTVVGNRVYGALTREVVGQVKTPLHMEGSPAISGDFAVVGAGAIEQPEHKAISHPGMVLAVRISGGKEVWRYTPNDPGSSPISSRYGFRTTASRRGASIRATTGRQEPTMQIPVNAPTQLAVVPIFVNIGSTLIPSLLAALSSLLAPLLKPRELLGHFRRKPVIPLLVLAGGLMVWAGSDWMTRPRPTHERAPGPASDTDWARVAMDLIRDEAAATADAPQAVIPVPAPSRPTTAVYFRGGPTRCGFDGGPAPTRLKALWQFSEQGMLYLSSPTVVGNRVYGASCLVDAGVNYGGVFALDANTGKAVWQTSTLGGEDMKGFFSSPAITADGRRLVIGQGLHFDKDASLICLDTLTGKVVWHVKTPLHIEGSPAISGDLAVVGAGAIEGPDHKAISHPGMVLAVRISDGKQLWRYTLNDPESSPVIEDGVVYIGSGFNGNAVVALRAETDDELKAKKLDRMIWRTPTPYPATAAITLAGDLVLFGAGNGDYVFGDPHPAGIVMALDRRTGKERWRSNMSDAVLGAVAVLGNTVICPGRSGDVTALALADGALLWRQKVSEGEPVLAAPAFTGKYVYAVSRDGNLAVLRASDGTLLEKHYLNASDRPGERGLSLSSPTIAGGRVYVGSETGGLWCFKGEKAE